MDIKDKVGRKRTHGEIEQNLDVFGKRDLLDVFKNSQGKPQMSTTESSRSEIWMQERMM